MNNLITLDKNVIEALRLFEKKPAPELDISAFTLPFVVGSGNAYNTGLLLFAGKAAIFADESNFRPLIAAYKPVIEQKMIRDAVVISASGEKDSVWEVELAKEHGLRTTLLTTKSESSAAKVADDIRTFHSIAEPYTYNVSTYMGMIMAGTKEDPRQIRDFIEQLTFPEAFTSYAAYSFVLPDEFSAICPMLDIKKNELFGPHLGLRAFSDGHARHAKFVIRSPQELVISLNTENTSYGLPEHRWHITIPDNFSQAAVMAITYYIIGKIQSAKHPYYKENIEAYVTDYGPKAYGKTEPFDLIVQGSE